MTRWLRDRLPVRVLPRMLLVYGELSQSVSPAVHVRLPYLALVVDIDVTYLTFRLLRLPGRRFVELACAGEEETFDA